MGTSGGLVTQGKATVRSVPVILLERYTEASRRVLAHAREEAQHRGSARVTVVDLLSGLCAEENTRAERIADLKANAFYLRWLVGLPALPARDSDSIPASTQNLPALDADAKLALAYAVAEADRDREYWIDTDHLLRGLLRFPNKANFAILKTEIGLKAVRQASHVDRSEFIPDETPNLKVVEYLVRKHIALWVPPIVSLVCYLYILIQGMGMTVAPLAH